MSTHALWENGKTENRTSAKATKKQSVKQQNFIFRVLPQTVYST